MVLCGLSEGEGRPNGLGGGIGEIAKLGFMRI